MFNQLRRDRQRLLPVRLSLVPPDPEGAALQVEVSQSQSGHFADAKAREHGHVNDSPDQGAAENEYLDSLGLPTNVAAANAQIAEITNG
jgi:hypothetical protein